jgi:hypothetical protein
MASRAVESAAQRVYLSLYNWVVFFGWSVSHHLVALSVCQLTVWYLHSLRVCMQGAGAVPCSGGVAARERRPWGCLRRRRAAAAARADRRPHGSTSLHPTILFLRYDSLSNILFIFHLAGKELPVHWYLCARVETVMSYWLNFFASPAGDGVFPGTPDSSFHSR